MFGWTEPLSYSFFVSAAIKSTAVFAVAWLSARLLYRQSAAIRHLVWTAAFAALLTMPFLSISLPALHVPLQRALLLPGASFEANAYRPETLPAREQHVQAAASSDVKSMPQPHNWPMLLLLLWTAGTAASMVQMLISWAGIRRIRRAARPLRIPDLEPFTQRLGIEHQPDLLEAEQGSMPMTFGLFRPAIFIPGDAAKWTEERRSIVLLHELAHVWRADTATHLLARIALSLYWWNPLAWMAWREFLRERERAADDLVLSFGGRPAEYATHLLDIARSMQSGQAIGWAAVAMARPRQLEERLKAILDDRRNRKRAGRASAVIAAIATIAIVAPLSALRAQENKTSALPLSFRSNSTAFAALQTQDATMPALPTDVDATIRAALEQKNPEMVDKAAEAAEALGKPEVAQKLLDSSLTIRAQVSGQQSIQYGMGLLKLGDLALDQGKFDQAKTSYTNALALLGNGPEAATALIHLGTVALATKDFDTAMDDFARAQSLNGTNASEAALWMAIAQQRQNNFEKADSFYQSALAGEDPSSAAAATTMELYAQLLDQQSRLDQANSMRDQAAVIRKDLGAQVISQSPRPNVYRIGGAVTAPKLLSKVEPEYSQEARIAKYQGTVTLRVEIGPDGLAHSINVVRGLGLGLNEKAMAAITQWKFNPGTKDGQPVTVMANVEINFRLL